jgi:hypothetical protein
VRHATLCARAAILLAIGSLFVWTALAVFASKPATETPTWHWTTDRKVLWIVNASRSMRTPPVGLDGSRAVTGFLGVTAPSQVEDDFKEGSLRVVETPGGLVLAVLDGGNGKATLAALESLTGMIRWQREGIELGDHGGFLPMGNTILARFLADKNGKSPGGNYVLSAIDLHDGREWWRTDSIPEKRLHVIGLPQTGLLLLRSHPAEPVRIYAVDAYTGAIRWQVNGMTPTKQAGSGPVNSWWLNAWTVALPKIEVPSFGRRFEFWADFPAYYQTQENFFTYTQTGGDLVFVNMEQYHHRNPPLLSVQRIDLGTGRVAWTYRPILILSLAVGPERVYVWGPEKLVVLDRGSGNRIAEWPINDDKVKVGDPPAPRYMYLDGDVLLLHRPEARDSQLRALDGKTGARLWQANVASGADHRVAVAGASVFCAVDRVVTARDVQTGVVTKVLATGFERPIASMTISADRQMLLRSTSRVVKVDLATWRTVFDSGEIRPPTRRVSRLEEILSGLAMGVVLGAMHTLTETPPGVPPRMDWALMERSVVMGGRTAAEPVMLHVQGSDNAFFVSSDNETVRLLRVDLRTGERSFASPFRAGTGVSTLVDDFNGVSIDCTPGKLAGYRYAIGDRARHTHAFIDAYSTAMDLSRRAQALEAMNRARAALEDLGLAARTFAKAAAESDGPTQARIAQLSLAGVCVHIARLAPTEAPANLQKAREILRAIIDAVSASSDQGERTTAEAARRMLDSLRERR